VALPEPHFEAPIDPLPEPVTKRCDPSEQEGPRALRALLLAEEGGRDLGIVRDCGGQQATSDHHAGAAFDWGQRADRPAEAASVDRVLEWLTATREGVAAAYARRMGLRYWIWDGRIWTHAKGWQPYSGASAHRDHVHFSFSDDGAAGRSTWYTAPRSSGRGIGRALPAVAVVVLAYAALRRR